MATAREYSLVDPSLESPNSSRPRSGLGEAMDAHLPCLAWYRYAKIRHVDGGPIRNLQVMHSEHLGLHFHIGITHLSEHLSLQRPKTLGYADCDGSGIHSNALEAAYRATSEALERWAWMELNDGPAQAEYGFQHDPTSTGLAAYPGWTRRAARPYALREALERFCLRSWWEGRLEAESATTRLPGSELYLIRQFYTVDTVALILQRDPETGLTGFGCACDRDHDTAARRAWFEAMARIRAARALHQLQSQPSDAWCTEERRTHFFSSAPGTQLIRERLRRPAWLSPRPFRLLLDTAVEGPWSRYASVWRCVAEAPSDLFRMGQTDYISC